MSSTITKLSPVEVRIEISVPAEEIAAALEGALARVGREATIRGFRRGKAPRGVIKRLYGRAVLADLKAELVSQRYVAAIAEHGIDPVAEPELESAAEIAEGAPFACALKVEVGPRLEELAVDGVEIELRAADPDPAEVEGELKRLQAAMAKTAALAAPRPARDGDAVRLEIRRWKDGAWQEPLPPQELVLGEEGLRPELATALPGLAAGDEKEIVFPAEEGEAEPPKFLCKVLEVKERALPAIDDELAKDVGDFDTLDALKADIGRRLAEARERDEEKRQRTELFDKLRAKNPLELPPKVVDAQARMMAEQLMGMMARGAGEDAMEADAAEKLAESARAAAREIVHQHFLVREIARLGGIEVTDADVEEELGRMAAGTGLPLPQIKARMAQGGRLGELKVGLLERKVFAFVKPKVKIAEKGAAAAPAGAGAP